MAGPASTGVAVVIVTGAGIFVMGGGMDGSPCGFRMSSRGRRATATDAGISETGAMVAMGGGMDESPCGSRMS